VNQLITLLCAVPLLMAISVQRDSCTAAKQPTSNPKNAAIQEEGRMNKGTWGGNQISMEVTEEGARIEFDCAHGIVTEPIRVDRHGKFRALGTHFRESGGPQRVDSEEKGVAVVYSGTTDGKTATFTITNSATDEVIGSFSLTRGKRIRLHKCL
jgi:hypothetical protein